MAPYTSRSSMKSPPLSPPQPKEPILSSASSQQRGPPLSISTSRPHLAPPSTQSPTVSTTQPPPSPYRTLSSPNAASPSTYARTPLPLSPPLSPYPPSTTHPPTNLPRRATSPFPSAFSPNSATSTKNLRFAASTGVPSPISPGSGMVSPTSGRKQREGAKRRHSEGPKVNVHTECGRHSDEWLFGGFSVAGAVRRMLERGERDGK